MALKRPSPRSTTRQPRLLCLNGERRGQTVLLTGEGISLGRVRANDICICDPHVSRRHARIARDGDAWSLVDRESQNGTFVNDAPVRERILAHGDEIRIAEHRFVFLLAEQEGELSSAKAIEEGQAAKDAERTITVKAIIPEGLAFPAATPEEMKLDPHFARRLLQQNETLRAMAEMLVEDVDRGSLLERIARMLLETFHAERSCILIADRASGAWAPAARASAGTPDEGEPPISQTVVQKVASERVSLLCRDALSDTHLQLASSVVGLGIRSVMATPLLVRNRLLGGLYVDNRTSVGEFRSEDLWLFRALANQIAMLLDYLRLLESLRRRLHHLQDSADQAAPAIVGESPALREVVAIARKAAVSNATVLVLGESGTGKEVIARSIHRWSPRRDEAFMVVNCTALADQLLQSDLFGHERGAFTGAIRQKRGRLEIADGGTVFLDEIGEIDREMQAKFLRFLQEHEFERLGGTQPIKVDVRVIAASNRDLAEEVRAGRFREDLYYRLRVVEIVMPPLRDRPQDVPLLADAFLREYAAATGRDVRRFSAQAASLLKHHSWPGNIRELRNCIERAVVLGSGEAIEPMDLGLSAARLRIGARAQSMSYREQTRLFKRELIEAALEQSDGQHAKAAGLLGLQPAYLSRLMKNLGMR